MALPGCEGPPLGAPLRRPCPWPGLLRLDSGEMRVAAGVCCCCCCAAAANGGVRTAGERCSLFGPSRGPPRALRVAPEVGGPPVEGGVVVVAVAGVVAIVDGPPEQARGLFGPQKGVLLGSPGEVDSPGSLAAIIGLL